MAQEALKKLEDQLNCPICLDSYTEPKQLQCHHIYCRKCLVKLVERDQQGQLVLTCPNCRQLTPVPANGVTGLQPAFHINNLLELHDSFKKVSPVALEEAVSDTASDEPHKIKHCSEHQDKELELYCETCEEPICLKCALKGSTHHSHSYLDLTEAFKKYRKDITPSLEPMEKQLVVINEALALIDGRCGEVSDQQAATEANIHDTFKRLHEILEVRKTQLIDQLQHISRMKLKSLAIQRDQVETSLAQLSSCLGLVKESLWSRYEREVMTIKKTLVKQVQELTTSFQPDSLKPSTEADMIFIALDDLRSVCQNFGQVSLSSTPDPSKCYATGKGIEGVTIRETSTAVLHTVNCLNQPCEADLQSVECEIISEITGTRTRGAIKRRRQSQYEISFQLSVEGRHQLNITVDGQHIRGSPFSFTTNRYRKTGAASQRISVKVPRGLALKHNGELVVTESIKHCISVLSPSGEQLQSFGTYGPDNGQLAYPHGVAVDHEGNIIVADTFNHRIQKFSPDGQFLTAVGSEGTGPLHFSYPKYITFNSSNRKFYLTDDSNCVQILNSNLSFSGSFGKEGDGKGQFNCPRGMSCDSSGNVYVADKDNHRIQVFTAKGKFLRMFGRHGEGRGELDTPLSVAVDRNGVIFVSEKKNYRISTFTTEGKFVSSMGRWGKRPAEFRNPYELVVDGSSVVHVCDAVNECIQIFK